MAIFKGAGVALITPMKADGAVNLDKMGELIDDQLANGTDALVICGTTGEASTLTHEEHIETIAFAVQKAAGRAPVIAGTGSNCTETAVQLSQEAERRGADGLLVVTPYYNKATQNGLKAHFMKIAAAVSLPILLYNIPGRTGCTLQPQTIADLAKQVDNIVGIKEASGNMVNIAHMMQLCDGKFDLYSGNDNEIVPILALGGIGVISVVSHLVPRDTHEIVAKFLDGDHKGSLALQLKYSPLIAALLSEVNPIPVKKALNLMGKEVGPLRMPLTEMEDKTAAVLADEMRKVGLL